MGNPSADSRAPTATPAPAVRGRAAAGPPVGADTSTSAARVPAASAEASAATPGAPSTAARQQTARSREHDTIPPSHLRALRRPPQHAQLVPQHRVLDLERGGSTTAGDESGNPSNEQV